MYVNLLVDLSLSELSLWKANKNCVIFIFSLSRASTLTMPVQEDHPRLSICPLPAPHPVSPTQTHPSWIMRDALKMLPFPVPLGTPQSMEVLISVCFPVSFCFFSYCLFCKNLGLFMYLSLVVCLSIFFFTSSVHCYFCSWTLLFLFCFFSNSLRTFTNFLPISLHGNTLVLSVFTFTPVRLQMTCH